MQGFFCLFTKFARVSLLTSPALVWVGERSALPSVHEAKKLQMSLNTQARLPSSLPCVAFVVQSGSAIPGAGHDIANDVQAAMKEMICAGDHDYR